MLDQDLIQQLQSVFSPIENEITLRYFESKHEKQIELLKMLEEVASTNSKIKIALKTDVSNAELSAMPRFEILKNK